MYKNVLQNITNIEMWPLISFVIFFVFFLGLLVWVFTVDKKYISEMSSLPLKNDEEGAHTLEHKNDTL